MSKFLRFIVNLFIVVAVLTAAAILIPPLAGINTTIIDSASIDTNLPLGSITYSRSVSRESLAAGDEVLRESSGSVYAYVIKEVGEDGEYTAVSAADENASDQTITLGSTVLRVAVMVPYIGYVVMALQSTEGILILILTAVLIVVLFILSELWKPDKNTAEEENETEEEPEPVPSVLTSDDNGGIDTDVIRRAMNENNDELASQGSEDRDDLSGTGTYEIRRASARASSETEDASGSGRSSNETDNAGVSGRSPYDTDKPVPDRALHETENVSAAGEVQTAENSSPDEGASGEEKIKETAADSEKGKEKKKSWRERRAEKKARKQAEKAERTKIPAGENTSENDSENEKEDASESAGQIAAMSGNENRQDDRGGHAQAEPGVQAAASDETSYENARKQSPSQPADPNRFIPVNRPTLSEILDEARKSGDKPRVKEDEATGITTVDYTDVL